MNVTSEDYPKFKSDVIEYYKTHQHLLKSLMKKLANIRDIELRMVERYGSVCHLGVLEAKKLKDQNLDWKKLRSQMGSQFYNPEVLELAACSLDSLLMYASPSVTGGASISDKAKSLVSNLHRFGESSSEGYALLADVDGAKDFMVIKVPRDNTMTSMAHEYVVGTYLNRLRASIPTFAYILGCFRCPPPKIDKDGTVLSWCDASVDGSRTVPYVIYENIAPSITMDAYVSKSSRISFTSAYLSVLLSLIVANHHFDFTHYDLHTKNVLGRNVGNGSTFQVAFPIHRNGVDMTLYVKCDTLMTIIDYGRSYVKVNEPEIQGGEIGFGNGDVNLIVNAEFPDKSWPLHDAYKLLMFCAKTCMYTGNKDALVAIKSIYSFFSNEPIETAVKAQWDQRYSLPYIEKTKNYTLMDLLDHIVSSLHGVEFVLSKPNKPFQLPVLRCDSFCLSFSGALEKIKVPSNLTEYYDTHAPGHWQGRERERAQMEKEFNYKEAEIKTLKEVELLYNLLAGEVPKLSLITITPDTVIDEKFLTITKTQHATIYRVKSLLESLELKLNILKMVARKHGLQHSALIDGIEKSIHRVMFIIHNVGMNAMKNYQIISTTFTNPLWNNLVAKYPKMRWFIDYSGDIMSLESKISIFGKNFKRIELEPGYSTPVFPNLKQQQIVIKDIPKSPVRQVTPRVQPVSLASISVDGDEFKPPSLYTNSPVRSLM